MKKSKTVLSVMSFATALTALSLSSLASAQMPSGEPTRAPHPEYFEQKADRLEKPDCFGGKQHGEMKRFEHKQRAKHAEFKAYIDSLPKAERDYIKSEFKAIRKEREANMRRMAALNERLNMHRPELREKMSDPISKQGEHTRNGRDIKKLDDRSYAYMTKGPKPQADEDQSHQDHHKRPQHKKHEVIDKRDSDAR